MALISGRTNSKALRRHIGIVMQDTLLFSTTMRDNIAYGREDLDLDTVIAAAQSSAGARLHYAMPGWL